MGAPFEGFRAGQRATAIPVQFFTDLLPSIADAEELRVTLYALYALQRPGKPALRRSALASEAPLARSLDLDAARRGIDAAVARGVLLALPLEDGDALLFLNNEGGRRLRDRIASGAEPAPEGGRVRASTVAATASGPAVTYEQEIGLLTPSVGAALAEAEQKYPAAWIVQAIEEAARQNARSWAYAEAILRRWAAEGRDDEAAPGHPGRRANPYDAVVRRGYD